ncbi:MAG: hypothetical protein NTX82_05635 [Candidatus Parcubacteria bacterium]|nr:hypothetical protein [Candidatus Parcubacteria bacterium]
MDIKTLKPEKLKEKIGRKKMPKLLKIIVIVLVIVALGAGIYYALDQMGYVKAMRLALQYQKQTALNKEDAAILNQLKKIMVLPDDINPTMANITDIEALKKSQPGFFATASNGQKLIIYPDQAIIFDQKSGKIVKVGPVQVTGNQNAQVQPVNFAVYNSLKDDPANAKTAEMETKIKTAFNNAVVTVKENSAKIDYPQTLVVDIAGNNPDIQKIVDALGAKLSGLPIGEKKPEGVAVLVIIGKQ